MYGIYYSIVTYGIIVWGSANKTTITPLYKVHAKIVKILTNFNTNTNLPLDLYQKYIFEIIMHHYKELSVLFEQNTSITRNKLLLLPKAKLEIGRKSLKYSAIINFNKLPNELKKIKNKNGKNKIKSYCSTIKYEI